MISRTRKKRNAASADRRYVIPAPWLRLREECSRRASEHDMSPRPIAIPFLLALLALTPAAAEPPALLEPGSYEVSYRLELPHVERWAITRTATICIASGTESRPATIPVLSGNTPFAHCAARDFRRQGRAWAYSILCSGRDAAKARASYVLAPGAFRGRIHMIMGAKNMTMTEVQVGRRTGHCHSADESAHLLHD
jgi:hypothetical protein